MNLVPRNELAGQMSFFLFNERTDGFLFQQATSEPGTLRLSVNNIGMLWKI